MPRISYVQEARSRQKSARGPVLQGRDDSALGDLVSRDGYVEQPANLPTGRRRAPARPRTRGSSAAPSRPTGRCTRPSPKGTPSCWCRTPDPIARRGRATVRTSSGWGRRPWRPQPGSGRPSSAEHPGSHGRPRDVRRGQRAGAGDHARGAGRRTSSTKSGKTEACAPAPLPTAMAPWGVGRRANRSGWPPCTPPSSSTPRPRSPSTG